MNKLFSFCLILIFVLNNSFALTAHAYSYGDPGEEQFAEAYKELEASVENGDWENARKIYETYQKDFDLYFTKVKPDMEKALDTEDKDLLLRSYQAAMELNVERRLHFAQEQFDDYGQAKLLLAKARGTFSVLEPEVVKKADQETVDNIYKAFDDALTALGNPGLFGIGSKNSDKELFDYKVDYIKEVLHPLFPIVSEEEKDKSHLTEENLGIFSGDDEGNSTLWLIFSAVLIVAFILIIVTQKLRKKK
ncbi:hypothetical protein GCM10009865_34920 [Aeromicrobium ponti]|uniref:Sporulation protein YpjB n=1 Tax=Cytobacillus oceanisediminis TaxID=665099 RepID=A0A562JPG0_9BACI|nr:hypothetical protein [Cytobacillus oceanisediminis]TWH84865.1 hypothetical protein IQ19_03453 [Cytobacillus oceanisediminis]